MSILIGTLISMFIIITFFWPGLCRFISTHIIPWVEEEFGKDWSNPLINFTQWLNGKITAVRVGFAKIYRWFKERILRMKSNYKYNPNTETVTKTTVTATKKENNDVEIRKYTEIQDIGEIPPEVMKLILHAQTKDEVAQEDGMETIDKMVKNRCEQDKNKVQTYREQKELEELNVLTTGV